jgi:ABC-type molybdate transport system substrate-binding protein
MADAVAARVARWLFPAMPLLLSAAVMPVIAQDGLVLYGAGSLREAMTEMANAFRSRSGVPVSTQFGASGRMRERIEAGDRVDVFTSADIGHARKLVDDGRAGVMAMFAQNSLCLLTAPGAPPVDEQAALAALLKDGARIGVSPPRIDPLGDYTVELFKVAGRITPGADVQLQSRATVLDNPPGSPAPRTGDYMLDALTDRKVDLAIVYCSGRQRYAKLAADAAMVPLPPSLQVGPQYGLAVIAPAKPDAMRLALFILSPEGQAILSRNGFKPIGLPGTP